MSCGTLTLALVVVMALLALGGWWLLTDHKPGIAPDRARQELDSAVVTTVGAFNPPIVTVFNGYEADPDYSNFHLSYTKTGRATLYRTQQLLTVVSPGKEQQFRDQLKDYWKKNGYSSVHESTTPTIGGQSRQLTATSHDGVTVKVEMGEYKGGHITVQGGIEEVTSNASGDPFLMSPPTDPSVKYRGGPWPTIDDPYWSH